MTVRIHEADGTPYEHVLDIRSSFKRYEVPFNTKYKRVRRNTKRYLARQAAAQAAAAAPEQSPTASQGETAGWQSVTGHKKEQSRAQNQASAAEADQKRAYIKNVYSQVQEGSLRAALSKFGDIEYLDLSRGKVSKSVADLQTRANIPTERCFR